MYRSALLTLLLPTLWLADLTAATSSWPHLRGPDHQTAVLADATLEPWTSPAELWTAAVGVGSTTFSVADGRAVTIGNTDGTETVYCFDAATGATLWTYDYEEMVDPLFFKGGPTMTPLLADGRCYWSSRQGQTFCLDLDDGSEIWRRHIPNEEGINPPRWGFSAVPIRHEDLVIFNMGDAGFSLHIDDGRTVWRSAGGGAGYASPVLIDTPAGNRALIFSGRALVQLDPTDGSVDWRHPWHTKYDVNAATPIVTRHGYLISSGYGAGSAMISVDGQTQQWHTTAAQHHMIAGVLIGEHVYGVNSWHNASAGENLGGSLYCLDPATGTVQWSQPGFGCGTVLGIGERLLVLGESGNLVLAEASPTGYQQLAEHAILGERCWNLPAYVDGVLFAKNDAGSCIALDLQP